jgi:hypothetical protein
MGCTLHILLLLSWVQLAQIGSDGQAALADFL